MSDLVFSRFKPPELGSIPQDRPHQHAPARGLMQALKTRAALRGIPYQRLIHAVLEREVKTLPNP